mmetsp:Transcript_15968/g.24149  ORF Transcript_15968/g.24149 Transcript_15968/m.24149 type:complete len:97 (-) Transcript_15968:47-337(-)
MVPPQYYLRSSFIAPFKIYYCLPAALNETATQQAEEIKDPTMGEKCRQRKKECQFYVEQYLAAGDLKNSAQNVRFGVLLMLLLLCIYGRRPNLALT